MARLPALTKMVMILICKVWKGWNAILDPLTHIVCLLGTRRITRSLAHVSATQRMGHQDVEEVSAGSVEDASEGDPPRTYTALHRHLRELILA
ncbi:hypothetical protein FIBSPDRAFT_877379 [Athelia psychrophila]|uniref:Secreted protein n=1 Tax=Athelia psychrophila TaxID=1759441 RepID=A0A167W203_9AGAM|nr:hypothetical protein FIBSPDRAFT_877379 [Fibularhizoctonia sp. CBS 109695]